MADDRTPRFETVLDSSLPSPVPSLIRHAVTRSRVRNDLERELLHTVRQDSAFALITGRTGGISSMTSPISSRSVSRHRFKTLVARNRGAVLPAIPNLTWFGMKNRRLFLQLIGVAIGASVLAMAIQFTPGEDPSRVYYGTDTRLFAY